jgi:hypothetical protein
MILPSRTGLSHPVLVTRHTAQSAPSQGLRKTAAHGRHPGAFITLQPAGASNRAEPTHPPGP